MQKDMDVYWHDQMVTRLQRESLNGHKGCVIWFTGLSASGKSTLANVLDYKLFYQHKVRSVVLDGDNIRHGLNASPQMLKERHDADFSQRFGIGFSAIDREENIRRIGSVAKLFSQTGIIAITAFISPYRKDRDRVRGTLQQGEFFEIFIDTPITVCEKRDPKGLYKKAKRGELKGFTGIDAPYEPPLSPELILLGDQRTPESLADELIEFLKKKSVIA